VLQKQFFSCESNFLGPTKIKIEPKEAAYRSVITESTNTTTTKNKPRAQLVDIPASL
jgi:hypothetical protein